jgi:thiamine-phosphate pyrophosphorylase
MPIPDQIPFRLCLVTPDGAARDPRFPAALESALAAGEVAALFVTAGAEDRADELFAIAQRRGVAVLVVGDVACAITTGADGVLAESAADLDRALALLGGRGMIGAGGIRSRHEAMLAGEKNPDYLFFGRLDGDGAPALFPKALALAAWWSDLFQIPSVLMGGSDLGSAAEAARSGVEFVALRSAVWDHPSGPAAAVAAARELLDRAGRKVLA